MKNYLIYKIYQLFGGRLPMLPMNLLFKNYKNLMIDMKNFDKLLELIEKLRSESGCPWDREQTIKSLREDLMSEAKEVAEAIDKDDYENLKEEIGDLIWSAALITQIAKEEKLFDMDDVLKTVNEKMVRRHPHVFGDKKAKDGKEAKKFFNEVKNNEKKSSS